MTYTVIITDTATESTPSTALQTKPKFSDILTPEQTTAYTENYPNTWSVQGSNVATITTLVYPSKEVRDAQQADPMTSVIHAARDVWRESNRIITTYEYL